MGNRLERAPKRLCSGLEPASGTARNYGRAWVYGHIARIDMSVGIKRHSSMMLCFDRLGLPDGHRASIHAEIVESAQW